MLRSTTSAALLLALAALPPALYAAGTRTHVSNAGDDANTAFSCDYAHPCRTFAAALAQTTPGGEILAIDSSGYGKVDIDRSVSIIAAPGVFAGIGVGAGGNATGIRIAAAGVNVVLKGLTLTGQGGDFGITVSAGASSVTIENCAFSGFGISGKGAITVFTPANIRVTDSVFRDNYYGLLLQNGATATVARSRFFGNYVALSAFGSYAGTTTRASISDSVFADGALGIISHAIAATAITRVNAVGTTLSRQNTAAISQSGGGTAVLSLSKSLVTGNSTGLYQFASGGGTATLNSLHNNILTNNTTNTDGVVTTVSPL